MASIIAHEITEAATDPQLSAWFDSSGRENADKCAWMYGKTWKAGSSNSTAVKPVPGAGGVANAIVGQREFMLQLNWANRASKGYCDSK